MQPKSGRKRNDQLAGDLDLPVEVPVGSGASRGFGRGYTIGAATGFCLFVAAFINLFFFVDDETHVARGFGYLLIAAGASFVFVIVYQMVQRIGIPWSVDLFGRYHSSGIVDPQRQPSRFLLISIAALLFFLCLAGAGIWMCIDAGWVAGFMRGH